MAFKVVLDANVLYPFSLRDTLLRLAERELYVLAWSERILDEVSRNLVEDGRADAATAARLKAAMRSAFPEALVDADAIAATEPAMANDPGDRHVLVTAVVAGAEGIVTFNARHFPATALAPFGKQQIDPDDFLCTLLDIDGPTVADAIAQQAADLRRSPLTPAQCSTCCRTAARPTPTGPGCFLLWMVAQQEARSVAAPRRSWLCALIVAVPITAGHVETIRPAMTDAAPTTTTDPDGASVELTAERWHHILSGHPDLAPCRDAVVTCISDPDNPTARPGAERVVALPRRRRPKSVAEGGSSLRGRSRLRPHRIRPKVVPMSTIATIDFDTAHYDRDADVLYLSAGDPARAVDFDETAEGHALRYDENGDLIGITIVGARKLVDEQRDVHVQAPVTLAADSLAQIIG